MPTDAHQNLKHEPKWSSDPEVRTSRALGTKSSLVLLQSFYSAHFNVVF